MLKNSQKFGKEFCGICDSSSVYSKIFAKTYRLPIQCKNAVCNSISNGISKRLNRI
ncbi:unknown [[Mannheimia] succiniciproducens MBEL55E]|uniref:Uncharacterized protein n=1 Tax=Mannheimia succiniciproducens (strain KCTC 0769BP / MBEL55E) TaxID=221988 RepID=Q65QQ5_MANSM|nr:unknown [[Mannheimia] succiniciproducens MBEL55E]